MFGLRVEGKMLPVVYSDRADAERDGRNLAVQGFLRVQIVDLETDEIVMRIGADAVLGNGQRKPDRVT